VCPRVESLTATEGDRIEVEVGDHPVVVRRRGVRRTGEDDGAGPDHHARSPDERGVEEDVVDPSVMDRLGEDGGRERCHIRVVRRPREAGRAVTGALPGVVPRGAAALQALLAAEVPDAGSVGSRVEVDREDRRYLVASRQLGQGGVQDDDLVLALALLVGPAAHRHGRAEPEGPGAGVDAGGDRGAPVRQLDQPLLPDEVPGRHSDAGVGTVGTLTGLERDRVAQWPEQLSRLVAVPGPGVDLLERDHVRSQ
jgi:hypothetical protein